MAEVFGIIRGKPFDHWLSHRRDVRKTLSLVAHTYGARAKAIHASHHYDGHSYIEVKRGGLDWYVILNDMRGQEAAMSIEFGRAPDEHGNGGWPGTATLQRAFGLTLAKASRKFN